MNIANFNSISIAFSEYTALFRSANEASDKNILLKIKHSERVMQLSEELAVSCNYEHETILLAKICGLLHDIGRFEQYRDYQTFSDNQSIDHGCLGQEVIDRIGILNELNSKEHQIIKQVVLHHNRKEISNLLDEETTIYVKIIRDADKLDILKLVTDYYLSKNLNSTLVLDLPETESYNSIALEYILRSQIVDKKELISINDFKLLQISWVFDINFQKSYQILKKEKYIEEIFSVLPNDEQIKKASHLVLSYLNLKTN